MLLYFKQKTAYEMRISDWSSDVCSSDLAIQHRARLLNFAGPRGGPQPGNILHTELENLTGAIKESAPSLSNGNAQEIALGTISEWIMRCPLDFQSNVNRQPFLQAQEGRNLQIGRAAVRGRRSQYG